MAQQSLFGSGEPSFDPHFRGAQRRELTEGAWLEYVPGWLSGHASLFDRLRETIRWRESEQQMYDRIVHTPRLVAWLPDDGDGPPILERMRATLSSRYGEEFSRVSLAHYRDGRDSVAWHGDRVARTLPTALVATVSLGAPRRLLLRAKTGGASLSFKLGWGDLFVMGGTCQRTHQHAIPKVSHADPRIVIMFRPFWEDPIPESP